MTLIEIKFQKIYLNKTLNLLKNFQENNIEEDSLLILIIKLKKFLKKKLIKKTFLNKIKN